VSYLAWGAAREVAAIGGHAGDEGLDPVERRLAEGGEGVGEDDPVADALTPEVDGGARRAATAFTLLEQHGKVNVTMATGE
jgi:hypothetical protein